MKYDKKITERTRIRQMPRVKHVHNHSVQVKTKGSLGKFQCDTCPSRLPTWWRVGDYKTPPVKKVRPARQKPVQAMKTSGWLSGSGGTKKDPHGAQGSFVVLEQHVDPDGVHVIDSAKLLSVSLDPGATNGVSLMGEGTMYLDPDHPHSNIPDEDEDPETYLVSYRELSTKTVAELKEMADGYDVTYPKKIVKKDLIDKILKTQDKNIVKVAMDGPDVR